jgi:hypothetical protein
MKPGDQIGLDVTVLNTHHIMDSSDYAKLHSIIWGKWSNFRAGASNLRPKMDSEFKEKLVF